MDKEPEFVVTEEDRAHTLALLRGMKASDPVARIGDKTLMAGEAIMSVQAGTRIGQRLVEQFAEMRNRV